MIAEPYATAERGAGGDMDKGPNLNIMIDHRPVIYYGGDPDLAAWRQDSTGRHEASASHFHIAGYDGRRMDHGDRAMASREEERMQARSSRVVPHTDMEVTRHGAAIKEQDGQSAQAPPGLNWILRKYCSQHKARQPRGVSDDPSVPASPN